MPGGKGRLYVTVVVIQGDVLVAFGRAELGLVESGGHINDGVAFPQLWSHWWFVSEGEPERERAKIKSGDLGLLSLYIKNALASALEFDEHNNMGGSFF